LQLQQHRDELEARHVRVAVVTFDTAAVARAYVEDTGLGWPLLVDETRALYRAYGIDRGRIRDVWGFRTWLAYLKEFSRGAFLKPLRADSLQLGADIFIDPAGVLRYRHVGDGPAGRPPIEELVRVLEGLQHPQT
jgi:alkyl hydroperoxide reductase subunit AhpC